MSIIQRTAFHANMKSCPVQYERQRKSFTHIEHHIGVAGRLQSSLLHIYFPGLTVRILYHFTLQRSVAESYPIYDKNSAEITVLMLCEKKLYPV